MGLISRDPGDVLAEDEGVNVVGAFIGLHRFQIHHVAHDGVVLGDAVGAENVASHPRGFESHPHVVSLGHGDVLMSHSACVLETAHVEREQLSFRDFGEHPDQFFLNELVARDGLIVELLSCLGISQSGVVAIHCGADRTPTDAVARLVEAHERDS